MNTRFMRLLAERLEHLFWIEVIPDDCLFLEFFDSMDGFFHVERPEVLEPSAGFHIR